MQPETISIVIEGAPVPKGRPRIGMRNGRPMAFTPANTRTYEDVLRCRAGDVMVGKNPIDAPVQVDVIAFLPVPQSWSKKKTDKALAGEVMPTSRPDADNYLKIALDGLNEIVYRDDSLATKVSAEKRYSIKPRLEIHVTPIMPKPSDVEASLGSLL